MRGRAVERGGSALTGICHPSAFVSAMMARMRQFCCFLVPTLVACSGDVESLVDTGEEEDVVLTPEEVAAELVAPGPHGVGYTEQNVAFNDPSGEPRELRLAVWYPSPDTQGEAPKYLGFVDAPGVMIDAAVADGPFPVVVFSHGHMAYAEASGFLMAHLASHGWVVAAPDHTNNTIAEGDNRTTEIYFQRPADLSAVVDHLEVAWAGVADVGTVVGVGHSFGGYTLQAWAGATYDIDTVGAGCADGSDTSSFCSTMTPAYEALFAGGLADPRVDAIVSIGSGDLRLFGPTGIASVAPPGLWVAGGLESANAEAIAIFDVMQDGVHRRVEVEGAQHNWCTDLTAALDVDATLDSAEGWRVARGLTLAWARGHGLGDAAVSPVLDGAVSLSSAVEVYQ
jgi:predicted dienelactone hydrolase